MKIQRLLPTLLCTLAVGSSSSLLNADVTVSSDPVGYYRVPLITGFQTVGVSLVNSPELITLLGSSSTSSVTSTESSIDVGTLLDSTQSYYVEVIEGPTGTSDAHVGHRFEVDEAATINSSPDGEIALDLASAQNTSLPVPNLSNYRVELRQHVTLAEAFDKDPLYADFDLGKADQVQIYNGVSFSTYYLLGNNSTGPKIWGTAALQSAENIIIPPGIGVLFKRSPEAATTADVVVTGKVRANPFVQPLLPGFNFVSEPYPVTSNFTDRQALPGDFTPNFDIGLADQVQVYDEAAAAFETYYLAGTATSHFWLLTTDFTTDQTNADIFDYRRAVFVKKGSPTLDYRVPLGWTP